MLQPWEHIETIKFRCQYQIDRRQHVDGDGRKCGAKHESDARPAAWIRLDMQ